MASASTEKIDKKTSAAPATSAARTATPAGDASAPSPVDRSAPKRTGRSQKQLVWTTPRKQALVQAVRETRGDVPRVILALKSHAAFASDEAAVARLSKPDAQQLVRTQFNKLVKAAKKEGIDETTLPTLQSNRGKGSQASIKEIFGV